MKKRSSMSIGLSSSLSSSMARYSMGGEDLPTRSGMAEGAASAFVFRKAPSVCHDTRMKREWRRRE